MPSIANINNGEDGSSVRDKLNQSIDHLNDTETTTELNARDTANRNRDNHTGNQPISSVTDLQTTLDGKAGTSHNHDDRYYTESETNSLLAGKADTSHHHDSRYYTETEVDNLLADKANLVLSINAQTGTSYTLVIGDSGKVVTMDNSSAMTVTVPTNASVAFAVGTAINILRKGSGTLTITGASGVTVNGASEGSESVATQYQGAALLKVATNEWIISGDLS